MSGEAKVFSHAETTALKHPPLNTLPALWGGRWGVEMLPALGSHTGSRGAGRYHQSPLCHVPGPIFLVNLATNDLDNALLTEQFCSRKDLLWKPDINGPGAVLGNKF